MKSLTSLVLTLAAASPLGAQITLTEADERLRIEIGGKLFTEYRSDRLVPCLYPIISSSGAGLTRNYPFDENVSGEEHDHPHHVSVWFTHGLVNGVDFWAQHLEKKGRIVHKSFGPRRTRSETIDGLTTNTAEFSVMLSWKEGDIIHLTERRNYTIISRGKTRLVDSQSVLTASHGDVLLGDTKEGTAGVRVAPTLRSKGELAKGSITNSNGEKNRNAWGKRAKWVAYSGPDAFGQPAVVAMFDHPANLRHPTWWHARDYGLLAANPFGQHDFEGKKDRHVGDHHLKKGESLTLRYRILFHEGSKSSADLDEEWRNFAR
ncbi:PmoA family protein [Haloferula chungangensis]|uniref:PmoA family protein n=1 Tax=Haloferula chungangensis TaxID=1048331 RepID=A0ABW2L382_9BACT